MTDILVTKINKSFNGVNVLTDFSHTFFAGSVTCVMGSSGCGKTTLLHTIMGLIDPDSGHITGINPDIRLGVVFQEDRLCENLSAILNVCIVSEVSRSNKKTAITAFKADGKAANTACRADAAALLSRTGLDADAHNKPARELSGGMKRRVAIARALIIKPDILLLDEPFAGLDDAARDETASLIIERMKDRTIIMVSHSEEESALLNATVLKL